MAGPARTTIRINKAAVDYLRGWNGEVGREIEKLARHTVKLQKALAPKRTGHLAASIHYTKSTGKQGISFTTESKVKHAIWMEEGTRPHIIRPKKRGGVLAFYWPKVGRDVALRHVMHPGTKGHHFMQRGLEAAMRLFNIA